MPRMQCRNVETSRELAVLETIPNRNKTVGPDSLGSYLVTISFC